MRVLILTMAVGLGVGATRPVDVAAQGRVGDRLGGRAEDARARGVDQRRGEADRRDERGRDARVDERRGERLGDRLAGRDDGRDRRAVLQGGPPFCSNGRGHPVHGMRWCRERGYASAVVWQRAPWDGVRLRDPQRAGRADAGRAVLIDILGPGAWGRVDAQRRALGVTDAITGRWIRDPDGTAVLRLSAGGVPIAEFIDRRGNGVADFVRINVGR